MPTATPSFESRQYCNSRFTKSPQSFGWLVSLAVLIPPLLGPLSHDTPLSSTSPSILHIGCGTSDLSNILCRHVPPSTITNVNFSHRIIKLGIQRMRQNFAEARTGDGKEVCHDRRLTSLTGEVFSPRLDSFMAIVSLLLVTIVNSTLAIVCPANLWPVMEGSRS
jgi:hypothetical protein